MTSSSWCKTQVEMEINGVVHCMSLCEETHSLLLCDSFHWTILQVGLNSSSSTSPGLSLQPQKTLNLEQLGISNPTSVQIASRMGNIFIGCDSDEGISVLDRSSLQMVKKFAQNLNRDFDHIVVDEAGSTVYTSSTNSDMLTQLDYNSGSVISELSVTKPDNIILKDDQLYLIGQINSVECVLVIDKHSLEIQSHFGLNHWTSLGGLCVDGLGNVCVTACDESNHRFLLGFDGAGKLVGQVQLDRNDRDVFVLDMVAVGNELVILTQEPGPEFILTRIQFNF